jgi:hypothetical protein
MWKLRLIGICAFACLFLYWSSMAVGLPLWLICLIPPVTLLIVLAILSFSTTSTSESEIRRSGIETEGTIIRSELYYGDGLNSGDAWFNGEFEFTDYQGTRRIGSFSGYSYDPNDYLSQEKSLEFPLEFYYRIGNKAKVTYLKRDPSKYIFHGPIITFIDKPSDQME